MHWVERYAFGGKLSQSPAESKGESAWLGSFGAAAWVYRIFITFTIIIFVADKFFGLGFLAAVLTIIGFIVLPLYKGIRYLLSEPRIERVRGRALGVTAAFLGGLFFLLGVVPFPDHFRAPGVIKAADSQYLITGVDGAVEEMFMPEAVEVPAGAPLLGLRNPELMLEIADLRAELARIDAVERQSFTRSPGDLAPLAERRRVTEAKLDDLLERRAALQMDAPVAGRALLFNPNELQGRWVPRGTVLGEIIGESGWEFRAVVSQDDAGKLFSEDATKFELRFSGSADRVFAPQNVRLVPGQQDFLPSPALAWPAGGPVRLAADDRSGLRAYEPFFLVVGRIDGRSGDFWHGRTGVARFSAPARPLLQQWLEDLRQLLQRRFQI